MASGETLLVAPCERQRRRLLAGGSLSLIEERDRRAFANPLGKIKGIPVGKPDAAM